MRFLILPLLAAISHLDLHRIEWEFGPEVIYNVTVEVKGDQPSTEINKVVEVMDINYKSQLKCRFGIDEYMKCHFENSKTYMHYLDSENPSKTISIKSEPYPIDNIPFEIKFNERGIEELVVPSSIDVSTLNKFRAIVNQLHTGVDFISKFEGTYQLYENFTIGTCLTTFGLRLANLKNNIRKEINEKYKTWIPGMTIKIDKTRNMKKCQIYTPYFFENTEDARVKHLIKIDVKSSESKIIADHFKFISSTKTNADVYKINDAKKSIVINVRDNITIIYDSVVPAKESYTEIDDPISVKIMAEE